MNRKIILIGGSPCAGKSFLASKLSQKLGIPWISTDIIRSMMQKLVKKEDFPYLFDTVGVNAEEYLTTHTPDEVIQNQNLESLDVWKGVLDFIETNYTWDDSYIIEGVAILPEQVNKLKQLNSSVQAVFLIDEDHPRLKEVIYTRGLWDDANKYPDYLKEIEHQWLIKFNQWVKEETQKYNLPLIKINKREGVLEEALDILNLSTTKIPKN